MSGKYWETEKPQMIQTPRNLVKYYKEAGRLQVSILYKDSQTGEPRQGKTATLDAEDCAINPEILDILQKFIDDSREQIVS
jgi:hypothetical protein